MHEKKLKNRHKYDVKLFSISFKSFKANIIEKLNGQINKVLKKFLNYLKVVCVYRFKNTCIYCVDGGTDLNCCGWTGAPMGLCAAPLPSQENICEAFSKNP